MNASSTRIKVLIVALIAGLFLAMSLLPNTAAAQQGPVKVTVKITDGGFDPAVVEIDQGSTVEMTFVWANVAYPQDEHIIVLPGYKLETPKLTAANRQATVTFLAAQAGSFEFKCDIECDAHDALQGGQIKVKASSGGTTAKLTASKLVIDPVNGVLLRGDTVTIGATLKGEDGQPIPRAEVRFYDKQQFLGHTGLVEIGVSKTLANGYASLLYRPTTTGPRTLVAKFDGVGLYGPVEQEIPVAGSAQFAPVPVKATDDSLHGLKQSAHFGLLFVIGSVWAGFGFMAYQTFGIKRAAGGGDPR